MRGARRASRNGVVWARDKLTAGLTLQQTQVAAQSEGVQRVVDYIHNIETRLNVSLDPHLQERVDGPALSPSQCASEAANSKSVSGGRKQQET